MFAFCKRCFRIANTVRAVVSAWGKSKIRVYAARGISSFMPRSGLCRAGAPHRGRMMRPHVRFRRLGEPGKEVRPGLCPISVRIRFRQGNILCRCRFRLASASNLQVARFARAKSANVKLGGVSAARRRSMTTAWMAHNEGTPVSSVCSRGGRFQDFLANVVGEQGEDEVWIKPTQASRLGTGW
jgi:hypothetical protein